MDHRPEKNYKQSRPLIDRLLAGERVDRPPVVLYFDFYAAARQKLAPARFIADPEARRNAVVKTFRETGADGFVIGRLPSAFSYASGGFPNQIRLPGRDLPEHSMWQFEETRETILLEDYDFLARYGWNAFLEKLLPRFTEYKPAEIPALFARAQEEGLLDLEAWRRADIPIICGGAVTAPFEVLTAGRTMLRFFEDLILHPDQVRAALEGMLPDFIESGLQSARLYETPAVVITAHRSCGSLISPSHFEIFALPYLKQMTEAFQREGLQVMLHLDCNWSKNLPYLRDFPEGTIIHTDGSTDLREARKVLGQNYILMGDVPAIILARGKKDQVERYCEQLLNAVADQSSFILSSGCDVPMDAQAENVRALAEAAERFGRRSAAQREKGET